MSKELKKIIDLTNNENFIKYCAEIAPSFLTKKEWNNSKKKTAFILQIARINVIG